VSERGESARDAQQRVGDARRALTASTRALLEAVLAADHVNDADLTTATTMIDALTAGLREGSPPPEALPRPAERRQYGDYLPRSLLTGLVHPVSPAAAWTFADGVLDVRAVLSELYEGPPGYVHGGFVALAFDELFGMVNVLNGLGGLTGKGSQLSEIVMIIVRGHLRSLSRVDVRAMCARDTQRGTASAAAAPAQRARRNRRSHAADVPETP